jgi:hypothetical protein
LGYTFELAKIIFTRRPPKYNVDTNFYLSFDTSESESKTIMSAVNFSMADDEKQKILNSGYDQASKQFDKIINKIFFNQLNFNKLNLNKLNVFNTNNQLNKNKTKYHEI